MAKLSAHGQIIGKIELLRKTKAYCSDGKILANYGDGWKLFATVKAGITPQDAYQHAVDKQRTFLAENPAHAAFRAALLDAACLSKRWKLLTAMELLGDDIDGIWSECCDGFGENLDLSLDEIADLVRLSNRALEEQRARKAQVAVAA